MSPTASSAEAQLSPKERFDTLLDEVAELMGQRNALDGRLVQIVAEMDGSGLWGASGLRSVAGLVAWMTGSSSANAKTVATVAGRLHEFPQCAQMMVEGRLSLDQIGVIAAGAGPGSDAHYAALAECASVTQLAKAIELEPRPAPNPKPDSEPRRSITRTSDENSATYRLTLPLDDAAVFDAARQAHHDALIAQWKRDQNIEDEQSAAEGRPPMPTAGDAFMSVVEAGWDVEAERRPHGQRTTVVVHLDIAKRIAGLHLGPLLSDADRRYLLCDATCEVWFERDGQPIGAGRSTRVINRRLRRALEHRDSTCVVPGCGATRGLHAHHIRHWEDGGATELDNLVLVCPYHHRLHHRGGITITGPAHRLVVTDAAGRRLEHGSRARPPTKPPPSVKPWSGPTGERADWWWYDPFEPQPPPSPN